MQSMILYPACIGEHIMLSCACTIAGWVSCKSTGINIHKKMDRDMTLLPGLNGRLKKTRGCMLDDCTSVQIHKHVCSYELNIDCLEAK